MIKKIRYHNNLLYGQIIISTGKFTCQYENIPKIYREKYLSRKKTGIFRFFFKNQVMEGGN